MLELLKHAADAPADFGEENQEVRRSLYGHPDDMLSNAAADARLCEAHAAIHQCLCSFPEEDLCRYASPLWELGQSLNALAVWSRFARRALEPCRSDFARAAGGRVSICGIEAESCA